MWWLHKSQKCDRDVTPVTVTISHDIEKNIEVSRINDINICKKTSFF